MTLQWDEMPHLYGGLLLTRGQTTEYMSTYGFYPPIFDLATSGYFRIFGASAWAGRLVAFTFSLLAIVAVFALARQLYGSKNALLTSILLATMPGFFNLARLAMLETILIFFFTLSMFAFYLWISKNSRKALLFSGLALGIGILAKYQLVVAAVVMMFGVFFLCRGKLKLSFTRMVLVFALAASVAAPWFLMVYQASGTNNFQIIAYTIQEGSPQRPEYSNRFFTPVFYLIEMAWPYATTHPVALPIMILGLCGLGLFAYRRKPQDLFLLAWFLTVYVFFTLVPHREWRYVDPLFPVLAISAASFVMLLWGKIRIWKPKTTSIVGERLKKAAAALFIILISFTVVYSSFNVYEMSFEGQYSIPFDQVAAYLAEHLSQNQSAVLLCATNVVEQDMFRFYLPANMSKYSVWQYPEQPVDAYTPDFNITHLLGLCEQRNVKYVILFDYGPHMQFFNSTLDYAHVLTMLNQTGRFGVPTDQPFFGDFSNNKGYRLFLVRFNQTLT